MDEEPNFIDPGMIACSEGESSIFTTPVGIHIHPPGTNGEGIYAGANPQEREAIAASGRSASSPIPSPAAGAFLAWCERSNIDTKSMDRKKLSGTKAFYALMNIGADCTFDDSEVPHVQEDSEVDDSAGRSAIVQATTPPAKVQYAPLTPLQAAAYIGCEPEELFGTTDYSPTMRIPHGDLAGITLDVERRRHAQALRTNNPFKRLGL